MTESVPLRVALWGPSGAGKTALLSALYHPLAHESRGASLRVLPTEDSMSFVRSSGEDLADGRFPPPTPIASTNRAFFRIERGEVAMDLRIEDRAGGRWTRLEEPDKQDLLDADGLVVLVDAQPDLHELVSQLRLTLSEIYVGLKRLDRRPIAVCLSKADTLIRSAEDLSLVTNDPEEFVRQRLEGGFAMLDSVVARFCEPKENRKFFALSSVGVRLRYGVVESVVFLDESLTPRMRRGTRPINVTAPFEWLMEKLCSAA